MTASPATIELRRVGVTAATGARPHSTDAWRYATWASATVVVLSVVESVLGLVVHGLYHEDRWAIAALRGNDLVSLVLVAPAFGVAVARGKRSAR